MCEKAICCISIASQHLFVHQFSASPDTSLWVGIPDTQSLLVYLHGGQSELYSSPGKKQSNLIILTVLSFRGIAIRLNWRSLKTFRLCSCAFAQACGCMRTAAFWHQRCAEILGQRQNCATVEHIHANLRNTKIRALLRTAYRNRASGRISFSSGARRLYFLSLPPPSACFELCSTILLLRAAAPYERGDVLNFTGAAAATLTLLFRALGSLRCFVTRKVRWQVLETHILAWIYFLLSSSRCLLDIYTLHPDVFWFRFFLHSINYSLAFGRTALAKSGVPAIWVKVRLSSVLRLHQSICFCYLYRNSAACKSLRMAFHHRKSI